MALPPQVEQAGKRADKLIKEMEGNTNDPKNPDNDGTLTPDDPAKKPEPAPDNPKPNDPPVETVETLTHKLSVLQGKYNKEVQEVREKLAGANLDQMNASITTLTQQVSQLTQQNADLVAQNKELQEASNKPDDPAASSPSFELSDEDKATLRAQDLDLDDKTMNAFAKVIGAKLGVTLDSSDLHNTVKTLKSDVAEVKETTQQDRFLSFVSNVRSSVNALNAGDFDTINDDEAFINWLKTSVSPAYPGETRKQVMDRAGSSMDSTTAIALFKEYIEETKSATPPDDPNTPDPNKPNPLESEVEPNTSSPTDPSNLSPKGRTYTPKQVADFYKEVAVSQASDWKSGEWAGKESEAKAMWKDIDKASTEGRIVQGNKT